MHFKKNILFIIFILSCISLTLQAKSALNVWDVLADEFSLNHQVTRPEVQNQILWIVSHPSYLQQMARKAEPYIYHIITQIRKRKLPGEIALIPMIESSYDPFAYSGVGAAGLWQLMPGTGTDLGLKQDWWYDGRRSIGPSTDAALNYLAYLHNLFHGDWLLAIAAYNYGEGALSKTMKNNSPPLETTILSFFKANKDKRTDFWSLKLPQETRAYIPRLLALAEVMKNPQRYKINLPVIPHEPYFKEVDIGRQIDLNHAAKLAGISYKDLIKLNPGFNHWTTAPYRPFKLLIPVNKVERFNKNLANLSINTHVNWHPEKKGRKILPSQKKSISLKSSNNQQLKVIHIVQRNESLKAIAKKYNVSTRQIQVWNQLNTKQPIQIRQQLVIWKPSIRIKFYLVKPGDNIGVIARKNKLSPVTLAQLNPGILRQSLQQGQKIRVA